MSYQSCDEECMNKNLQGISKYLVAFS